MKFKATASLLGLALILAFVAAPTIAATPATQTVSVPRTPGQVTVTWTGTAVAGAISNAGDNAGTGACSTDPTSATNDTESFTINVPDGVYKNFAVTAQFRIDWQQTGTLPANPVFAEDALPDLAMSVENNGTVISSSDGSVPHEQVTSLNPQAGPWSVLTCSAIAASNTPYTGTLTITVAPVAAITAPPSANAQGLQFSASLVDEIQYWEGEPLVTLDRDGTIYTCGPAGSAYPAADFGQASLDGGDQFNRLGDPTTGRMGLMGGGDCALGTGIDKNSQGNYQLAYAGLSNLAQFTVSTSPDKGQTLTNSPFSSTAPLADRQWLAFTDALTVYLTYINEQSFGVIHKSTDGGLVYAPATILVPSPTKIGQIRTMTKTENPAHNGQVALYFPWNSGNTLALAISQDAGTTWNNCSVATSQGAPNSLFPVMDHDSAGNLYLVYTDQADMNTYLVVVPASELSKCQGGSGATASISVMLNSLPRVQMNRDAVVTSVMPWVAAGGAPGRVAVSFYGSSVAGRPDDKTLPHVWNVYVSQTLNALSANPAVAQVKVSTHPNHYDQVCMSGVACSSGGDRRLDDFFAIAYNPINGELDLVYNQSGKKPGDADTNSGNEVATTFARQIAGPSNGGAVVANNGRSVLRQSTVDPTGDAYAGFSGLVSTPTRVQVPALDLTSVSIDPPLDLTTGSPSTTGGFTVTLSAKDLSPTALSDALTQTSGQSLLWMFYYWSGYSPSVAMASWTSSGGFTFATGDAATSMSCVTPSQATVVIGCSVYPATNAIEGKVDQVKGIIQMTVPLTGLHALADVPGPARSPAQVAAAPGDRIYSAAAYTFADLAPAPGGATVQDLLTVDNTAPMDFLIPGSLAAPAPVVVPVPSVRKGRFGGAIGWWLLLPMVALVELRRRKPLG